MRARGLWTAMAGAIAALALAVGVAPRAALAQSPADRAQARDLFDRGRRALDERRFAEARDLLQQSMDLVPNAGAAFNLALALRETGQTTAAITLLDGLIGGAHGAISDQQRGEVTTLRTALDRDIALIHVSTRGIERAEIRVDGVRAGETSGDATLEARVDAGEHIVTATLPNGTTAERRITAPRGGSASATFDLRPRVEPPVTAHVAPRPASRAPLQPAAPDRTDVDEPAGGAPWLWIAIGAGALIAVGVAVAIVVASSGDDPLRDDFYGVTPTLSADL